MPEFFEDYGIPSDTRHFQSSPAASGDYDGPRASQVFWYWQTSQMLDAAEIPPIALRQIRREYIQHAIGAVESMPKDERFAAFTTLAMSESSYNYAEEVLEEARKKIIARASNDTNVERVYEMMLVAFPMSKKVGKEAEG